MHSLPIFLRLNGRPVMLIGSGEAAAAKRRLLERAGAIVVDEQATAAIAIIALEDEAEARSAAARIKARGILANVVDRSALCDFTLPAIVDRDPVIIAIGTGGASAGLAKALRQRFETMVPQSLGRLATGLHGARDAIKGRWQDGPARRRAIDAALDPGGPLDPCNDGSADAIDGWLETKGNDMASSIVAIRLGSDDPDDLTLRQARWLARADRIYHRPDVPAAILDRARADADRIAGEAPDKAGTGLSLDIAMARP